MLPSEHPTLPSWASYKTYGADNPLGEEGHVVHNGAAVAVEIHGDLMYPALLNEYRTLYADQRPDFIREEEWDAVKAELVSDNPSQYWLEVVYQSSKMDVQRVVGFGANLYVTHDSGKETWRQASSPKGRGALTAAGGSSGGRDARYNYKKLRGFLVA